MHSRNKTIVLTLFLSIFPHTFRANVQIDQMLLAKSLLIRRHWPLCTLYHHTQALLHSYSCDCLMSQIPSSTVYRNLLEKSVKSFQESTTSEHLDFHLKLNFTSHKPTTVKYKITRKPEVTKVNKVSHSQKHKQQEQHKNETNKISVSFVATEELLTNLASKLVAVSSQTQSYQDVSIINSAYHKVSLTRSKIY